jgi:subtilisin family serine protease
MISPNRLKEVGSPKILRGKVAFELANVLRAVGIQVQDYSLLLSNPSLVENTLQNPEVCGGTLLTLRSNRFSVDDLIAYVNQVIARQLSIWEYDPDLDGIRIAPNDGYTRPDTMMEDDRIAQPISLAELTYSAEGTRVAVIDSGFKLPSNLINPLPGFNSISNSPGLTGWEIDDVKVVDDSGRLPSRPTVYGHGTPVLGIIASIAQGARFIPIKACDKNGFCTAKSVTLGLCYAAYQGAKVINLSVGGFRGSPLVLGAVRDAIAAGALIVTSAGNSRNLLWNRARGEALRPEVSLTRGWNQPVYPAAWSGGRVLADFVSSNPDGLLSVASMDNYQRISKFSYLGLGVDVVTVGEEIMTNYSLNSSFNGFQAANRSGTSFAAPIMAGIVAVMRAHDRTATATTIKHNIQMGGRSGYRCILRVNSAVVNDCRESQDPQIWVKKLTLDSLRILLTSFGIAPNGFGRPS